SRSDPKPSLYDSIGFQRVKRIVPEVRLRLERMSLRHQVHSYSGNRKTSECFQWRDKLFLTAPGSHPLPRTSSRQHTSRLTSLGLMAMMSTGTSSVPVTRAETLSSRENRTVR